MTPSSPDKTRCRPNSERLRAPFLVCLLCLGGKTACNNGYLTPIGDLRDGPAGHSFGPCDVPVPNHVDLAQSLWGPSGIHVYIPDPGWALAVAHASMQLEHLQSQDLRLPPSFWIAIALVESLLGCSATTTPDPLHPEHVWQHQPNSKAMGCFQIGEGTAWLELCRLYPAQIDCTKVDYDDVVSARNQDTLGRSNFESGALLAAYYAVFAYAMLQEHNEADPDAWFAEATDPLAREKVIAITYKQGAWSAELGAIMQGCRNRLIEECLTATTYAHSYAQTIGNLVHELQAAVDAESCYGVDGDPLLARTDIETYLDRIAPLFPTENWNELLFAAHDAFDSASGAASEAPFQQVAASVLHAVDTGMQTKLSCPDAKLQEFYQQSCPP